MLSFPARAISSSRALVLKDSIFLQETSPAKLPVPVNGTQYEFTLRSEMTVGEFRKAVIANAENSVRIFNLLACDARVDDSLTLGELRQR